ncbi:MAG: hypothetical protein ACTHWH_06785 [Marinobacter sp.]
MNINLHIERLIVDDIDIQPQQRGELKAAVTAALRQQLVSQGTAFSTQSHTSFSSVNAGSISLPTSPGTESLGQQIGHAIYRGIDK